MEKISSRQKALLRKIERLARRVAPVKLSAVEDVTVVMATCGNKDVIAPCIESLYRTLPQNTPVIICDSVISTTDGTRRWLCGIKDGRTELLEQEKNFSHGLALDLLHRHVTTKYYIHVDADVSFFRSGWLESIRAELEGHALVANFALSGFHKRLGSFHLYTPVFGVLTDFVSARAASYCSGELSGCFTSKRVPATRAFFDTGWEIARAAAAARVVAPLPMQIKDDRGFRVVRWYDYNEPERLSYEEPYFIHAPNRIVARGYFARQLQERGKKT